MTDRESNQQWERLLMELMAAQEALDLANTNINALISKGVPFEQMDLEFYAKDRAHEVLALVRQRFEQYKAGRGEPWLQASSVSRY
jgi:hypothetical protein